MDIARLAGLERLCLHRQQIIKREPRGTSQLNDNRLLFFKEAREQVPSRMRANMDIITAAPMPNRTHRNLKLIGQLLDALGRDLDVSPDLRCCRRICAQQDAYSFAHCTSAVSTSRASLKR